MKLKRVLSIALCVLMLVSILPVSVLAEGETEAPVSYDLWVNGVNVTSDNATDVLGDGKVRYDEQGNMLWLTNATLSQTYSTAGEGACAIYYKGDGALTIIAMGRNIVNTINNGVGDGGTDSTAIYASGDLRLSGRGYLGAHGTAAIKSKGTVTIDSNIHLVAEAASSRPIEANSVVYPSNTPWRTSKTDRVFRETEPQFDGNYFEMLGVDHAMKARVFADNGNGTHKISCGECNEVILASAPHRKSTTLCDCGIPLAVVGNTNAYPEGDVYWLLHEALNTAAEGQYITLFTYTYAEPATMALHQSATVQSGRELLLGTLNGQSSGHNIAVGDGVTLTFAKGSEAYLLNNGLSLSGSGKVVDMGGDFYHWANSQPTHHSHQDMTKTYTDNGDGTHSATVNCSHCGVVYHVPMNAEGDMSAAHDISSGVCVCGVQAVAKVADSEGEQLYVSMNAAVNAWKDNETHPGAKTLTLLAGGTYDHEGFIELPKAERTLDLNGFTFHDGHGFCLNGTDFAIQDSSGGAGVYDGETRLSAEAGSFTLRSGKIVSDALAVLVEDAAAQSTVTVKGGSIVADRHGIQGKTGTVISVEGGSVISTTLNTSYYAVYGGDVRISGSAVVRREQEDGYAVHASKVSIQGDPSVGMIHYSSGKEMDFSGYTGAGLEMHFEDDYDPATDTNIKLPAKYGFFDASYQKLDSIAANSAVKVMPAHEHDWSFSAEGAVITATCSGSIGTCPVADNTATITLKAPANLTYNGAEKSCSVEQSVAGLFNLSGVQVEYSATPAAVGDYSASFTYEEVTARVSFSIVGIDIGSKTIEPIPDCTYTGAAMEPAVTIDGLTEGTDFTVAYTDNVHAGTATVTITGIGNYAGTTATTFVIKPAEITIEAVLERDSYEYSGSVAEPEVTVTTEFGGRKVNLAEDMDYVVIYGQDTAAGSVVPVTVKAAEDGSFRFEAVTLHYSIKKAIPAHATPTFTATYGQTLASLTLPTADHGKWKWEEADSTPVGAVGDRSHKATFTPNDSANYEVVSLDVPVKVEPAVITVTAATVSDKTYDGSDQVSVALLTINGIVGEDRVTIKELSGLKGTAPSANAGAYTEVTLPTLSLTGAGVENYVLTQPGKVPASFTISPKSLYPIVEVAAGTYRYTGAAQTPAVTVKDGTAVIPAEEYKLTYSSNLHAGTAYVTVSDVTGGNYTIGEVKGSFTIQPAIIVIVADNKVATTGQKAPTPTYTVGGLVAGEKLSKEPTVSYVTTPNMSKAGTTIIRAGGAVAPSANYTITYADGTLTVTKAASSGGSYTGGYTGNVTVTVDMSGVELVSKTYDGKPLSYGGKASARYYTGDFTYTWYSASGYKLSEAPVDAGDYVLRATVSRSGYTGYASKNVSIRKASLTITADDLSAEVGDKLPELSYRVKGLGSGDKLKTEPQLRFETEPDMSKPGKTPILISGAEVPDTKNYEKDIKYIEGTLAVREAEAEKEGEAETPAATVEPIRKLEVSVGSVDKALEKELDSKNNAHYELTLRESHDGGQNWAGSDSALPEGGVAVSLPLPEGSDENCSFRVVHAKGEYPVTVTKHEDGKYYLDFTATEPGSVAVGWEAPRGGFPWWILLLVLCGGIAVGTGVYIRNRKRRY